MLTPLGGFAFYAMRVLSLLHLLHFGHLGSQSNLFLSQWPCAVPFYVVFFSLCLLFIYFLFCVLCAPVKHLVTL